MSTVTVVSSKYYRIAGIHLPIGWLLLIFAVAVGIIGWTVTASAVEVTVDGVADHVVTHRATVGQLLVDLGLELDENDLVKPSLDTSVVAGTVINVQRARPFQIISNGKTVESFSWGITPRQILSDASIMVDEYDRVVWNGQTFDLDSLLELPKEHERTSFLAPVRPWMNLQVTPVQLHIVRAVPILVDDGGLPYTIRTTAQTVGEALREAEITIYLGDRVIPSLGSEVINGLRVTIQRSVPVRVSVDGKMLRTRTRSTTVAAALAELQVGVSGLDQVEPSLDTALADRSLIEIKRISEDVEIVEQITPFETVFVADANLLIDTQQLVNTGAEGITRKRYRVTYRDGEEIDRVLEDTWVAQEPDERRIAYGQKIEPKTFTTEGGTTLTYWRKIRMLASSYSASTAGVSPDKSYYGQTFTGDRMRHGIVAVDPQVISLRSDVFVPGYGHGSALDTGSAIRARRIDLGYDDDNLVLWNKWVDVYLLWPPPPSYQITWVLPNWPQVPQ